MKAFLSHSTKGQQFVDTFAAQLKAEKIERGIMFTIKRRTRVLTMICGLTAIRYDSVRI
jgi:hypothetical protein